MLAMRRGQILVEIYRQLGIKTSVVGEGDGKNLEILTTSFMNGLWVQFAALKTVVNE